MYTLWDTTQSLEKRNPVVFKKMDITGDHYA